MIVAEDEAKLYLQASTMAVWAPRGQAFTVRCDPGRAHTGFYGSLDLKTGSVTMTQATQMNGETTVIHLQALLDRYPEVPILVLWDRAPWHRGPAVRAFLAANPRLEIGFFPVAAPDANPQEHVWRATRRAVAHNHLERRLPGLADRFASHLKNTTFPTTFLDRYGLSHICPSFN